MHSFVTYSYLKVYLFSSDWCIGVLKINIHSLVTPTSSSLKLQDRIVSSPSTPSPLKKKKKKDYDGFLPAPVNVFFFVPALLFLL